MKMYLISTLCVNIYLLVFSQQVGEMDIGYGISVVTSQEKILNSL